MRFSPRGSSSADDGSYVDVELPRSEFALLRQRLGLQPGATVHLKPRRVTRFAAAQATGN